MIEKHIIIDAADPVILFGAGNSNLRLLRSLHPRLRLTVRGEVLLCIGSPEDVESFETLFARLQDYALRFNRLDEAELLTLYRGEDTHPAQEAHSDVIVYSTTGRPIRPRSENQRRLVEGFQHSDLVLCEGPAGSGKTYTAIALAVAALKAQTVRRIILSRPAVEAGEKLGFLPGDMREKIDPYLQPLYDALGEMLPPARLEQYLERGVIQIAPLAFMRGRTLSEAVILLDEAQNTTPAQLKMFLTRLGTGAKMIVTGDCTQIDLPPRAQSGLSQAFTLLQGVKGVTLVRTDRGDIVRHPLVERIVNAYERAERKARDAEQPATAGDGEEGVNA